MGGQPQIFFHQSLNNLQLIKLLFLLILIIFFRMPYTEATVLESLRVFTARAFSIPHRALKDTELCGYFIPKV